VIAARQGLHLPLVYNTGGYDSLEALALLDGVIDLYMPDLKYADSAIAHRNAPRISSSRCSTRARRSAGVASGQHLRRFATL